MTAPSEVSPGLVAAFAPPPPDRYSRFVGTAKRLLPLLAVGLLILVAVWPRLDIHFDGLSLIPKTDPRLAHDLRMLHTRYSGIDRENRPYVLTADAAEQLSNDINDLIGLEGPKADMTTQRGGWFESSAYTGTYQPQSKLLDLFGEVALYTDRGDEFHTDSAQVDMVHSTAQGDEHITGQGPFGHVVGDGFRVLDRGATIIFTGHANLVLEPKFPEGSTVTPRWLGVSAAMVGVALMTAGVAHAAATASPSGPTGLLDFGGATGGKGMPVNITADNGIEWRQAEHVYIARGNVKAVRGTLTVYADEMRAYYRPVKKPGAPPPPPKPAAKPAKAGQPPGAETDEGPTEVYRLEAISNVRFVTPTQTGFGDHADYDVDSTMLLMTGQHLKIITPHDTLTARDTIEWYDNRQLGVARGNAVDLHDGKTLAADVLLATIVHPPGEESHASRIDGRGNVFVSSKDQIGRGDTGVYDVKSGVVTLTGHVRLTRGKDEMRGNYGVVDVNRNVGYLLPHPPGGARPAGNRVQALIVPDAKNGAPGAAAPKKKKGPPQP